MGTEPDRPPKIPPPFVKHLAWRVHRMLHRLSGGRFLWTPANKRGWGALRLTTIGRRSGQERSVILGYLDDGPNHVVLAMNGWDEGHPAWWLNLEARPDASCGSRTDSSARCALVRSRATSGNGCGSSGPTWNRSSTAGPVCAPR